ncbi:hypothetical protein OSSY52_17190 [Tepiditoga spiralis]|uniref:HD-GYP domain-containing protein n=1 Tax=Tepiditoga spiralis TaxID=2108365 RepID=A0A7G1G4V6_9BACT|nr:HD-GYP domain-containing protein [Tepiditoga spiralis]BBE31578.1 hypothetical protein OSSY52_17190 [Tepiditoga spiralis]
MIKKINIIFYILIILFFIFFEFLNKQNSYILFITSLIMTITTFLSFFYIYILTKKINNKNKNLELKNLNKKLNASFLKINNLSKKLKQLTELTRDLGNNNMELDDFCNELLETAHNFIPQSNYGSISLIKNGEWNFISTIGHNINLLKTLKFNVYEINPKEGIQIININKRNKNLKKEIKEKLFLATQPTKETLASYIKLNETLALNISLDISKENKLNFDDTSIELMESFSNITKSFFNQKLSHDNIKEAYYEFANKLAIISEGYDEDTGNHVKRVSILSGFIAEKIGLNSKKVNDIKKFAQLHDIGKIFTPKEILNKKTSLTPQEWEELKKHTINSKKLLNGKYFKTALNIALYHHEKYDGTGYPFGLSKNLIPIEAQIVGIVDVYDALRSKRSYKEAFDHNKVLNIILKGDGRTNPKHFNPVLLKIFTKYERKIEELYNELK